MTEGEHLAPGELVQLNPETCRNPMFAGAIMTVTEARTWGAQGYVQTLGEDGKPGGQAYYRAQWAEMEKTDGHAPYAWPNVALEPRRQASARSAG